MIQRSMNFFQDIEIREVLIRVADLLQLPINVVHEALQGARGAFYSPNSDQKPLVATLEPKSSDHLREEKKGEGSGSFPMSEPTTDPVTTSTFLSYNPINMRVKVPLAQESLELRESDIEKRVKNFLRSSESPFNFVATVVRVTKYRYRPSVVLKLHTADDDRTINQKVILMKKAIPDLFSGKEIQIIPQTISPTMKSVSESMESSTITSQQGNVALLENNMEVKNENNAHTLRVSPYGEDEECPSKNCWVKTEIEGETFCELRKTLSCANIQCSESGLDAFLSYDVMGLEYRKGGGSLQRRFMRGKKWLQVGDESKEECLVKIDAEATGFYISLQHASCGGKLSTTRNGFLTVEHSLRYPFNDAIRRQFGEKKRVNSIDLSCHYPKTFNISNSALVKKSFQPGLDSVSTFEPLLSINTLEENYDRKKISVDFDNPFRDDLEFLIENCRFQNSSYSGEVNFCKDNQLHAVPYIFEYKQNSSFSIDCSIKLCHVNESCSQIC